MTSGVSPTLYRAFFDHAPDAVVVVDDDGIVVAANDTVLDVLGYQPDEVVGRPIEMLLPDRYAATHVPQRDRFRSHRRRRLMGVGVELRARRKDGTEVSVDVSLSPIDTPDGPVTIAAVRDVSDRERAENALRTSEHRFRLIFDHAPVGVALLAPTGEIRRANPALATMLRAPRTEIEGSRLERWLGDHAARLLDSTKECGGVHDDELLIEPARGERLWVKLTCAAVPSDDPELVIVVEDVTDARRDRLALEHRATHDPLTGLANRALLDDRLRLAGSRSRRTRQLFGVLYVDLDGFKGVNDRYGHHVGDVVLVSAADRLLATVRPGDTVARIGGDEFVVCCEDVGTDGVTARRVLDDVSDRVLGVLREPFDVGTDEVTLSACVGIAIGGDAECDKCGPQELLASADEAMYAAKAAGRGRVGYGDQGSRR